VGTVDPSSDFKASKPVLLTWRFKIHPDAYKWLNEAAIEVNQVWNYCAEVAAKAARPYVGKGRWLSGFDLCNLTSGSSEYFPYIGADTIQRICVEYAQKRRQARRIRLRWRKSFGGRRSVGWVPFKATCIRRHGKYVRFRGKSIRFFESARFSQIKRWQQGCFAQDATGDWFMCLPAPVMDATPAPNRAEVGIDLGLKDSAVTSDGERLSKGGYYRLLETKIARAQRGGHHRQVKRLHRKARRRRLHALHVFTRGIVNRYQTICIGDVSAPKLARTRMAKAVMDSGWGLLRTQLKYKGEHAGRCVLVVSERNTTRTCSSCGALSGPSGVNELRIRSWVCSGCGITQDRDVNAARNILSVGRMRPPDAGNGLPMRLRRLSRVPVPERKRG